MDVAEEVRTIVMAIPTGCVATYGEIARTLGIGPRQAGRAVSLLEGDVPWWRVVHADGATATCHEGAARALLELEGAPFHDDRVDMAKVRAAGTHRR
ncbi:MGMT family protein [Cryobacterium sp. PH31-AA6]|uniref:MGMT family protein n=1 Tax=Cryobacterium sp. PH31-AA6 TaxID=3046205 RepID=UPI0024B88E6D|nr:MGMT family protein [Cryobacterium sp. PH31-AA6]MDJ0322188.1 MGMT family protein [Cryobacterium sp. PH31-AA6]